MFNKREYFWPPVIEELILSFCKVIRNSIERFSLNLNETIFETVPKDVAE